MLAPEIVGYKGHDKNADWWSLGILLYELTVGIPPFYSQNVNEMYRKIESQKQINFPPALSLQCRDLVRKLLNKDPSKRLGSGDGDIQDIKKHPFFSDLDWDKLYKKELRPPFLPVCKTF